MIPIITSKFVSVKENIVCVEALIHPYFTRLLSIAGTKKYLQPNTHSRGKFSTTL